MIILQRKQREKCISGDREWIESAREGRGEMARNTDYEILQTHFSVIANQAINIHGQ